DVRPRPNLIAPEKAVAVQVREDLDLVGQPVRGDRSAAGIDVLLAVEADNAREAVVALTGHVAGSHVVWLGQHERRRQQCGLNGLVTEREPVLAVEPSRDANARTIVAPTVEGVGPITRRWRQRRQVS